MVLASDWVAFHADRTPEKIAMVEEYTGQSFTYHELNNRCATLASYMKFEWGIVPGDIVAILAMNTVEYFVFQFACIKLGAIMLPLNWRLAEPELLFILQDAEAKALLYDFVFSDRIPDLIKKAGIQRTLKINLESDSEYSSIVAGDLPVITMNPQTTHKTPITIMYTAGTTGHPKGVIITHEMTLYNAINIGIPTALSCDSVQYTVLPTFHTGGLNLYANPLIHVGGKVIVSREFDAGQTLKVLSDPAQDVTHFFGVPAIYLFLSQHETFYHSDLSRIVSWGCGGAPMPAALLKKYADRGIIIQLGFGMTETSPTVFLIAKRRAVEKPTSVGKPMLHTRVRVVDPQFQDVAVGDIGEVVISGPNITPGYHNRPEANKTNFTVDEYGNRWLHSGDAGTIDEEGCFYIVDRYKDMYISGGENVYPAEIEQVIFQLAGIKDVAVIGIPDEKWGESGLAIIVRDTNAPTDDKIIQHCNANLARYKVPKAIRYAETLPRNAAGKVLKRELRSQFIDS